MVNLNWWPSFRKLFVAHASSPKEHQTESEASWWQHSALGLFFSSVGTGAFVSVSGNYMKRFKYMSALAQNCQISARMQTKNQEKPTRTSELYWRQLKCWQVSADFSLAWIWMWLVHYGYGHLSISFFTSLGKINILISMTLKRLWVKLMVEIKFRFNFFFFFLQKHKSVMCVAFLSHN